MDQFYLGMFENMTGEPSERSFTPHDTDVISRSRDQIRTDFNAILKKSSKPGPLLAPALPPCPLCNKRQKWTFEETNVVYENVGRRYDVVMKGPFGPLVGYSEKIPEMTKEEKKTWRLVQRFGPLGEPIARMQRRLRGIARIAVRILDQTK